ncbi:MAG: hypothetical protein RJA19_1137 [Bacteroidota bacterium]|jgi:DNA-binding transcriptional MerR regulator
MQQFSIRDLEHFSGIKAHTIRMWEQRYQLLEPHRTPTNIRYYSGDHLKSLLNIGMLLDSGMRISQIAGLSHEEITERVGAIQQEASTEQAIFNALKVSMLNYDEALFRTISDAAIANRGFDGTVEEIYLPFLGQMGMLWLTNAICPAQEHFFSHLLREQLMSYSKEMGPVLDPNAPVWVLYLPEREMHDLSLLYFHVLARRRGIRSIFLGANVPFEDLETMGHQFEQVRFVSYCTTFPAPGDAAMYVERLTHAFGSTLHKAYLGGRVFADLTSTEVVFVAADGGALAKGLFATPAPV